MATAKFNYVDDFLAELRLDAAAGEVDRLILRVVNLWERPNGTLPITVLSVVASYTVGGEPVRLENRCGSFMSGVGDEEEKAKAVAVARREAIEAAAKECNLQVRGGVFE
jgi:hypothetical protein